MQSATKLGASSDTLTAGKVRAVSNRAHALFAPTQRGRELFWRASVWQNGRQCRPSLAAVCAGAGEILAGAVELEVGVDEFAISRGDFLFCESHGGFACGDGGDEHGADFSRNYLGILWGADGRI